MSQSQPLTLRDMLKGFSLDSGKFQDIDLHTANVAASAAQSTIDEMIKAIEQVRTIASQLPPQIPSFGTMFFGRESIVERKVK